MDAFTALDFETASGYRNSICQVGLMRVVDGSITNTLNLLVQPPKNYYWSNLAALCKTHCTPLNHHDARACGELYLKYLDKL